MTGIAIVFDVSVVIPLYNKADYIRRTLESVLAQSHAAKEVILVDDGSTDDSVDRIAELIGGKVRLVVQDNAGPGPARNRGIAAAGGEWIAFIDGDDLWFEDHLACLAQLASRFPEADAVASGFMCSDADCDLSLEAGVESDSDGRQIDYFAIGPKNEVIWSSCVAIRRSTLSSLDGFGSFFPGEDFDLWARLALDHCIAVTPRTTAVYVQNTGGLMDMNEHGERATFTVQPIFATLDRALADLRYAARHHDIRDYRATLLEMRARQALVRGDLKEARISITEHRRSSSRSIRLLEFLSLVPDPVLQFSLSVRSKLRAMLSLVRFN
jgi:hypothetical protein